jgi:hypothetical protein
LVACSRQGRADWSQRQRQRRAESWSAIGAGYARGYVTKCVCTKPLVAAAAAGLLFSAASNFASALSKVHVIVFQLLMILLMNYITSHTTLCTLLPRNILFFMNDGYIQLPIKLSRWTTSLPPPKTLDAPCTAAMRRIIVMTYNHCQGGNLHSTRLSPTKSLGLSRPSTSHSRLQTPSVSFTATTSKPFHTLTLSLPTSPHFLTVCQFNWPQEPSDESPFAFVIFSPPSQHGTASVYAEVC